MTKAIAERYLLNQNQDKPFSTTFKIFRWGNILGSRGSVLSLMAKTLLTEKKIYITDKRMTRFWMRIGDAVRFMLEYKGDFNKVNFPEMKAAPVLDVAFAVAHILNIGKFDTEVVGIRKGEKIHECLYSSHDDCIRSDTAPRFKHDELIDLIQPILTDLGYLS